MLALQVFYSIQIGNAQPPCEETLPYGIETQLFIEIARTFGLTFWLEDGIKAVFENS